jgi:hypothetical protein
MLQVPGLSKTNVNWKVVAVRFWTADPLKVDVAPPGGVTFTVIPDWKLPPVTVKGCAPVLAVGVAGAMEPMDGAGFRTVNV